MKINCKSPIFFSGANLVTSITLKAIQDGIRLPHSLVVAYPPYRLQFLPSPSRILCLMDPLLPVGVLKSCIQAYTGGFQFQRTENRSFTYDASSYNAFDLDFGSGAGGSLDRSTLQHSYSETQLNVIKAKYNQHMDNSFPEESESFCSEFPCSDNELESKTDSAVETENKNEDYIYFKAHSGGDGISEKEDDSPTEDSSSLLQSLTNQVSSKMMNITTSLSGYFSAATDNFLYNENTATTRTNDTKNANQQNISEDRENHIQKQHEQQRMPSPLETNDSSNAIPQPTLSTTQLQGNSENTIKKEQQSDEQQKLLELETNDINQEDYSTISVEQSERLSIAGDTDNILTIELPKKKFSICRQCLYKEEQCICHLSPKQLRRRSDHANHHHYRFSHHHLNNNQRYNPKKTHYLSAKHGRSNSLTSIDNKDRFSNNKDRRRNTSGFSGGDYNSRTRSITECEATDGRSGNVNLSTGQRVLQLDTSNALCSPTSKDKQLQNFRLSLLGNSSVQQSSPPSSPSATKDRASGNYSPRVVYDRTTESCVILTPDGDDEGGESKIFDDGLSVTEKSTKQKLGVESKAFNDAKDPLMSPFLADDEILKSLPPITIVVSYF